MMKFPTDAISDFNMLMFKLNLAIPIKPIVLTQNPKTIKPTNNVIILDKKDCDFYLNIPGQFKYTKNIIQCDNKTVKIDFDNMIVEPLKDFLLTILGTVGKHGYITHIHLYDYSKKPQNFCLVTFKNSKSCSDLIKKSNNVNFSKYNYTINYQKQFDNLIVYDFRLQTKQEPSDKVWIFGEHKFPDLDMICKRTYFNNRTIFSFKKLNDAIEWQKYFCSQKNLICGFVN